MRHSTHPTHQTDDVTCLWALAGGEAGRGKRTRTSLVTPRGVVAAGKKKTARALIEIVLTHAPDLSLCLCPYREPVYYKNARKEHRPPAATQKHSP